MENIDLEDLITEEIEVLEEAIQATTDHSKLDNLEYENSGHTGFQPTITDLTTIRNGASLGATAVQDPNYVHTDNNFTGAEKNKLSSLENYDDTEIKEDISELETNKADKSEIPDVSDFITKSVDDLLNYYLKSETYTKTEVNSLIGQIQTTHFEVVEELPETGESNVIYLVPKEGESQNVYNEFIWVNNDWELIGDTKADLTGYATEAWVNTQISGFLNEDEIESLISDSLENYYDKSEVDDLLEEKTIIWKEW